MVRNNDYLSFRAIIANKDGEKTLEIRDQEKILIPTLYTMRFNEAVFADDHVTFYGFNGDAIKILVFDKIQPNKNLPMLFGRELNIQKKS